MTEFPSHQASEREEVARRLAKFATFIAEQVTGKTHLVVSADPVVQTETDLILALQAEGRRELVERLTRPLISLENRTPLEVFDIMSDRIRSALSKASGGGEKQELSSARRSEERGCADAGPYGIGNRARLRAAALSSATRSEAPGGTKTTPGGQGND